MEKPAEHPILDAIASMWQAAAGVAESPAWGLSADAVAEGLRELHRLAAQVAELELRLVAQADHDDLGAGDGAASTAAWWAGETRQDRAPAKHRVRLGDALDRRRGQTREAMTRGHVSEPQARVIVEALDRLPVDLDAEVVVHAEKELVALAEHFEPRVLARLGAHVLEVVAPEVAEEHQRRALEAAEERALEQARFSVTHRGEGVASVRAILPSTTAEALRKMVLAHWHPGLGDGPRAQGLALIEMVERYPVDHLPDHGGVAPTLTITMTLDQLRDGLGAAGTVPLDTRQEITAAEARRLACEASMIPMVLGRDGAVLDVGRSARFHTRPQRVAIAHRDRTCTAEGCDCPPGLCHVHHDDPWARGGRTSVDNGRLLCPAHHRMIHSGNYQITPAKNGRLIFRRT